MSQLRGYLRQLKQLLASSSSLSTSLMRSSSFPRHIGVVLGNQACDADSMISSLCYAYLKHTLRKRDRKEEKEGEREDDIEYFPLMSIPRENIHFRREVKVLLELFGISFDDLICLEDFPLKDQEFIQNHRLELTLVDHNHLAPGLELLLSSAVSEIVDHHSDLGFYPSVVGLNRVIAFNEKIGKQEVGSACTLIAEKYFESSQLDSEISTLLYGVISLDTLNMDPQAGIGTERDRSALDHLLPFIPSHISPESVFQSMKNCKFDPQFWAELSVSDCLRIDYKGYGVIGMSSIMTSVQSLVEKDSFEEITLNYLHDNNLTALVIMSFLSTPSASRELMVLSKSREYTEDLVCYLQRDANRLFGLEPLTFNTQRSELSVFPFNQQNIKASRKQVAPEIMRFLELQECK